ncbi:wu:fc23c09 isoform X2 [Syngnathus typhle]|nr:wu:fc23c09 isoform X2 [Syngnathus typhle]
MEILTLVLLLFIAPLHLSIPQPRQVLNIDMVQLTKTKEESKDAKRDALKEEQEGMLVAGIVPHEAIQNKSNSDIPTPQSNPEAPILSSTVTPKNHKSISLMEDILTEVLQTPRHYSEQISPDVEIQPVRNTLDTRTTNAIIEKGEYDQNKVTKPSVELHKIKKTIQNRKKGNGRKKNVRKQTKEMKTKKMEHFPYFLDNYCPPDCACYGGVVQCSDKLVDKIPYGIPYSSRYVLLMNNHINSIQLDLLRGYTSMEFLVLSKNHLTDGSVEGAFEGIPALKRLYLDQNLLASIPTDLPASLEELRLDNNRVRVMSESCWTRCPGLLVLSLSNNSLGNESGSLPDAVFSPLHYLRTLNLDHNQLTTVPHGLPLSIKELYLRGNLIEHFSSKAFNGKSQLVILDLSANRLSNKGLPTDALVKATHLESLNLEGNRLKKVPRHLPSSIKTLNLEGNVISAIRRVAFNSLKNLEHLGLARNKISKVVPGAFLSLPALHQLDLCHNVLRQVPRQLPRGLHLVVLTHNKIHSVPRDAFCWGQASTGLSELVQVQLENNLMDMGKLDSKAFRCLRGFQVVHFY